MQFEFESEGFGDGFVGDVVVAFEGVNSVRPLIASVRRRRG